MASHGADRPRRRRGRRRGRAEAGSPARSVADRKAGSAAMEQGRRRRRSRTLQSRTPRRSQGQGLRRRDVRRVRQFHAGAQRHLHEVRYVRDQRRGVRDFRTAGCSSTNLSFGGPSILARAANFFLNEPHRTLSNRLSAPSSPSRREPRSKHEHRLSSGHAR